MPKCSHCGQSSLFLKLTDGLCPNCYSTMLMVREQTELKAKAKEELESLQAQSESLRQELSDQNALYQKIEAAAKAAALKDLEAEKNALQAKITQLNDEFIDSTQKLLDLRAQIVETDENALLQSFGFFTPHYIYDTSEEYKVAIGNVRSEQKALVKGKQAVSGSTDWTVNGDKAQGKKMITDMQKLLLRAFNSECDDAIEHVKFNNLESSEKKITASYEAVAKLGSVMHIRITQPYYSLKLKELHLMHEYRMKKQAEKDELKEARARMREEAKLAKELEEARKKLEKEQTHYSNALRHINAQLKAAAPEDREAIEAKKAEIEAQLQKIDKEFKDVDYRAANQRAGYVYVISNIGAFGENVYKIGMTRRLNPMDRVDELGDASVPFDFDVHAMIFSDDAPKLEAALHQAFADRKLNYINTRREFFRVSLDEIKQVVKENFDKSVEFIDVAPAEQYRETLALKAQAQPTATT